MKQEHHQWHKAAHLDEASGLIYGLDIMFSIQGWGVVSSVHPVDGTMDNPDSIKVGNKCNQVLISL